MSYHQNNGKGRKEEYLIQRNCPKRAKALKYFSIKVLKKPMLRA